MIKVERVAPVFALSLLGLCSARTAHADTLILRDAAIYTLDAAQPWARAVVVQDGRIAYVGDPAGTRAYDTGGARVVQLTGRMVMPGFHDAHTHPMSGGIRLLRCRLDDRGSLRLLYAAVRACAAAEPKQEWLLGGGWTVRMFGPAALSRTKLDELVPDRPAYLATQDGFAAWVNSKALTLAGIDPEHPDPQLAGIRIDASHHPSGVIEGPALDRVRQHLPRPTQSDYREALHRASAMANRAGITSLFDASTTPAMLDAYRAADAAGELSVRVVAAQPIDPGRGPEQVDDLIAQRNRVQGSRLRADAAKFFLDGEIDLHTAAMLEPYAGAPDARGTLLIERTALNAIVRRLDAEGFLIHMHAMGDAAVRAGLDALEQAMRSNGQRDRRHQLAHIGVASPEDVRRFGELGIAADFQPLWFHAEDPASAAIRAALGPERARRMYPIGSIAAAGGRITAGSDWPSTSMNPLEAIQVAMTRQPLDASKPALQPRERIGLAAMLSAYTKAAAWAAREDAEDGSISVGKRADLIVLDRNLFNIKVADLHKTRVLLTLLDGKPVYRDPALAWPE